MYLPSQSLCVCVDLPLNPLYFNVVNDVGVEGVNELTDQVHEIYYQQQMETKCFPVNWVWNYVF